MRRTRFPEKRSRLSPQQKLFAAEYIKDFNGTRAALSVGYAKKSAAVSAHLMLKNPEMRDYLDYLLKNRIHRVQVSQDRVVLELARIAFADISSYVKTTPASVRLKYLDDLSPDDTAAIREMSETNTGIRLRLHDKIRALELLGRHLGMWNDKLEVTGQVTKVNETRQHIIQELISDTDVADRIREHFRSRVGDSPS